MKDDLLDPSPRAVGGRVAARRRRRVLAGMALLVALALVVRALWHRSPPRSVPSPMAAAYGRMRLAVLSSLAAEPRSPSLAVSDAAAVFDGSVAVCGLRVDDEAADDALDTVGVEPSAADASAPIEAAASAVPPGWPPPTPGEQRILDAMAQSPDDYARAAALVIGPSGVPDDPPTRLGRLADMARHTAEARVYALAYGACGGLAESDRPAGCVALTTAQWARLDAGNGVPWLYALGDANRQGDAAARDDALFHLAAAERMDDRYADMSAVVADHMAPDGDEAAFAGWNLAARAVYRMSLLPVQSLDAQCSPAQVADANRRQTCAAIADRLIDHSSSLILASIGASVDRLVTGSAERADRLRAERDALLVDTRMTDFSCSGLRRQVHRLRRAAQIGELAALREAVAVPAGR